MSGLDAAQMGRSAGTIAGGGLAPRFDPEPNAPRSSLRWRLWANKVPESENVIVKTEPEHPTWFDRLTGNFVR